MKRLTENQIDNILWSLAVIFLVIAGYLAIRINRWDAVEDYKEQQRIEQGQVFDRAAWEGK